MSTGCFEPDPVGHVYQQLADYLAQRITSGELAPNTPLPSSRRLAEEYGLSVNTVRHAVRLLRYRGLVTTVRSKGTYVIDAPRQPDLHEGQDHAQ
ncbi:winged helix-turn-helix domain-containing protein [Amycolatopsis sacchari]|uniref:winged helix-turn-helix domain-containing protein n=1 Tax=Amycolatopsis sacchari TaxID=115433 RepID=UPI003D718A69